MLLLLLFMAVVLWLGLTSTHLYCNTRLMCVLWSMHAQTACFVVLQRKTKRNVREALHLAMPQKPGRCHHGDL